MNTTVKSKEITDLKFYTCMPLKMHHCGIAIRCLILIEMEMHEHYLQGMIDTAAMHNIIFKKSTRRVDVEILLSKCKQVKFMSLPLHYLVSFF